MEESRATLRNFSLVTKTDELWPLMITKLTTSAAGLKTISIMHTINIDEQTRAVKVEQHFLHFCTVRKKRNENGEKQQIFGGVYLLFEEKWASSAEGAASADVESTALFLAAIFQHHLESKSKCQSDIFEFLRKTLWLTLEVITVMSPHNGSRKLQQSHI